MAVVGVSVLQAFALDANDTNSATASFDVAHKTLVGFHVVGVSGAHNFHVLSLEASNDGGATWGVITNATVLGLGVMSPVNVPYELVRVKVTTAETAASVVNVFLSAK